MRKPIALLTAVTLCFNTLARAAEVPSWQVQKEKSFIKFIAIQNGAPVEGKFTDYAADIRFDHDNLTDSGVTVEVNTASITSANPDVQGTLKTAEWLGVEAFPKAVFICQKLTRMPQSENYYADGKLLLHGHTVPVVLNFQLVHNNGSSAIANGYVTLKRSDFNIGQGEWSRDDVLKNEVRVEFRIAAEKK